MRHLDGSCRSQFVASGLEDAPINQWWVIAADEEVGREPLARKLLGRSVVLYKTEDGTPVALPDRCPHRLMPLSQGKVVGDALQCRYHGFEFNSDGRCIRVPSQENVPGALRITPYPLVRSGIWLWIWLGDVEAADPSMIPNPGYWRDDYHVKFFSCMPVRGHFLRLHENLLDTSHPSYLHEGLFDDGELALADFKVEAEGRRIRLIRQTEAHIPNDSTVQAFQLPQGSRVIRTLISESYAPSLNSIINRFEFPDEPDRPPVEVINSFPVSPGDGKLCYQFWSFVSSFPLPHYEALRGLSAIVMEQDEGAIMAIECSIAEGDPEAIEISVRADEASMRFRRLVIDQARREREALAGDTPNDLAHVG